MIRACCLLLWGALLVVLSPRRRGESRRRSDLGAGAGFAFVSRSRRRLRPPARSMRHQTDQPPTSNQPRSADQGRDPDRPAATTRPTAAGQARLSARPGATKVGGSSSPGPQTARSDTRVWKLSERPGLRSVWSRLPELGCRSSTQPGQRGWFTLLDGKPIDPALGHVTRSGGSTPGRSETITRFGWWGGGFNGSPLKVGEYQGLGPSPFWDIDTIRSNGRGTVDLWGSQLNSESWDLRSHFFQNGFTGDVNFEQFPHLLENSPLAGGSRQSNNPVVTDNLNVGEDSAIRVQQLKVAFKGPLTKNIQWKIQFWMFRKYGERQVNSMAHCFNINLVGGHADNRCHVLSQLQHIDWLTIEVEPGLVAKFDRVTVDYTRTMRYFTPNDQTILRAVQSVSRFRQRQRSDDLSLRPRARQHVPDGPAQAGRGSDEDAPYLFLSLQW